MRTRLSRRLFLVLPLLLVAAAGWTAYHHVRQERLDQALVEAVGTGRTVRVEVLLGQGADPNARPEERISALWARIFGGVRRRRRPVGDSVLQTAVLREDRPTATALVLHGADPNTAAPDGETPLMRASFCGYTDLMAALIDRRAHVTARAAGGSTALCYAAAAHGGEAAGMEAVRLLLAHGADPRHEPALHWAVVFERPRTAELLLQRGAEPNEDEPLGWQPIPLLSVAAQNGDERTAGVLLRHGADPTRRDAEGRTACDWAGTDAIRRVLGQAEADWRRKHAPNGAQGRR